MAGAQRAQGKVWPLQLLPGQLFVPGFDIQAQMHQGGFVLPTEPISQRGQRSPNLFIQTWADDDVQQDAGTEEM